MSLSVDLTGRRALITGASSGLGARFGRRLAENGARVALGARRIGQMCYDLVVETGPVCVTVTDDAILKAQRSIWENLRQWVEPAGAAALAALISGAYEPAPDEKLAVLICGANPAPGPFD